MAGNRKHILGYKKLVISARCYFKMSWEINQQQRYLLDVWCFFFYLCAIYAKIWPSALTNGQFTALTFAFMTTGEMGSWGIFSVSKSACMTFFFRKADERLLWHQRVLHQADSKGATPLSTTWWRRQIKLSQLNFYAHRVGDCKYEIGETFLFILKLRALEWSCRA